MIVADEVIHQQTADILQKVHYAPELAGRISPKAEQGDALAPLTQMKQLLYTTGVNEVIFCINGLTYTDMFTQMQLCGAKYEYKIHLAGSQSFVGSNSSSTSGDLYTIDRSYNLSGFAQQRNKRMVDIGFSLILLLMPVLFFATGKPFRTIRNCFLVLIGKKTWVGYAPGTGVGRLPVSKEGILPPYNILQGYEPSDHVKQQANMAYAQHYTSLTDITLITKNFRHL